MSVNSSWAMLLAASRPSATGHYQSAPRTASPSGEQFRFRGLERQASLPSVRFRRECHRDEDAPVRAAFHALRASHSGTVGESEAMMTTSASSVIRCLRSECPWRPRASLRHFVSTRETVTISSSPSMASARD